MDLLNDEDVEMDLESSDIDSEVDSTDYTIILDDINNNLLAMNETFSLQEEIDYTDQLSILDNKIDVLNSVMILMLALMFIQAFIRLFNKFFMFDHI